ncbi:hypothetical protein [Mongoliibacter ruber]|uniref:Uncharacterized protein n=1 Tax=Mongoliibacter ruber TaxID=1750599 RepID=A0A2T0WTE2_9BACT|nr:hypothetical protein [Mongoliibacter ruber]PRY89963.1 hypothetical protein CLW00_102441 [Mongoliibacter ruber]
MDNRQFKSFVSAYRDSLQKGEKAKGPDGKPIESETDWIYFDRETLEKLLKMTDPKTGGIKMYLGVYTKENLDILPKDREDRENYIGMLSLALTPANRTRQGIVDVQEEEIYENGGTLCPPFCQPPPTEI